MFEFLKRRAAAGGKAAASENVHIAAQHTQLPLDDFMTRLFAQELPFLPSDERSRVYELLRDYEGPVIARQEDLPEEVRTIMDL